ncbi:Paraquat-inducible protein A [Roseovarius litorisediminis]|uniref:Paraquat-inducible protein A n=1 Tax=Roseovarius litorisediminis TaxID=1312363 RepID=A0A1Y5RB92_9RHOB|nr:paraquat-inducible protein A [Roseovarius litorisediminis]SLN12269.1 Paraquat-inducible protein A [Roseovarius litorisediminis]
MLKLANLALLVLFPISWFAPLIRAGWLPLFSLNEISVISGLQSLWDSDVFLALVVTFLALFAPYAKTIGLALIHFGLLRRKVLPALQILGKLAMADVFLVAVYITLSKGIGVGRVETAWGLYLFTACILVSVFIGHFTQKSATTQRIVAQSETNETTDSHI